MAELIQSTSFESSDHARMANTFSPPHLNMLLLGLGFATGMEFYTADSINLCLTDITGSFGVSGDEASWSLTVYSSALFLSVPVCVWLAGYVGHRSYLIGSVVLFAASSVVSVTAYSFDTMLVARAFQGLAGAGLVVWWRLHVAAQAAAQRIVDARVDHTLSIWRLRDAIQRLYHRSGELAADLCSEPGLRSHRDLVTVVLLSRPVERSDRRTDWPGIVLIGVTLVSLQVILSRGQIDDWFGSLRIRVLAWLGATALILFAIW